MLNRLVRISVLFSILALAAVTIAQEDTVIVPDVTGQNVAQAAAILNRSGLNLGSQSPAGNPGDTPPNTVVGQALAAGESVPFGTAVDLTVVLPPNARLIYDDNDITLVNITAQPMNTAPLLFTSVVGTAAQYQATTFWGGQLDGNRCFQLWSVSRGEPKSLEECEFIDAWRTTNQSQYYFWTQANGVTQFAVQENGVIRATCPAAPRNSQDAPTSCEFYMEGGGRVDDAAPFVYLAYTETSIAFINPTDDRFMLTSTNTFFSYNPALEVAGSPLTFGDPALLREEFRLALGDITRLAPGQCIVYTLEGAGVTEPPEPCEVIAQRELGGAIAFWTANFEISRVSDDERRICPAPSPGQLTRCILQR